MNELSYYHFTWLIMKRYNFVGVAGSVAGSAIAGAVVGSAVPGAGTVVGAAAGLVGGMVGYAVTTEAYQTAVEFGTENAELLANQAKSAW